MIPMRDFAAEHAFADLAALGGNVDHVSVYFNAGNPGVPHPHYHIVSWHVSRQQDRLGQK